MKHSEEIKSITQATADIYRKQRKMQQERVFDNEELKNQIERVVNFRKRRRAQVSAREKAKARIPALAAVRKTLRQASDTNAKNIKTIFNVSLYVLLLDQDLFQRNLVFKN
ncbi:MAG TPA: hypothetical protein VEW46_13325 [Pyrinomonadaceae bacterium]|nr:hypothetical protein [Pyrinomonadaceae bacterium]